MSLIPQKDMRATTTDNPLRSGESLRKQEKTEEEYVSIMYFCQQNKQTNKHAKTETGTKLNRVQH